MSTEKFTHSKKYSDQCLRDMAIMALNQINHGEGDGIQLIMAMSGRMHMHPQSVVQRLTELSVIEV